MLQPVPKAKEVVSVRDQTSEPYSKDKEKARRAESHQGCWQTLLVAGLIQIQDLPPALVSIWRLAVRTWNQVVAAKDFTFMRFRVVASIIQRLVARVFLLSRRLDYRKMRPSRGVCAKKEFGMPPKLEITNQAWRKMPHAQFFTTRYVKFGLFQVHLERSEKFSLQREEMSADHTMQRGNESVSLSVASNSEFIIS